MRASLGLIAIALLLFSIGAHGYVDESLTGSTLRVGMLMAVWWFAYPQLNRVPRWLAWTLGVMLVVVMIRPKLILAAVPVLIVLWFLRPRAGRGGSKPRS